MKNIALAAALAAAVTAPPGTWPAGKLAEGNGTVLGVYPSPAYLDPAAAQRQQDEALDLSCGIIARGGDTRSPAYVALCLNGKRRPVSEPPHPSPAVPPGY